MTHPRLKADYQTLVPFVRASDLSRSGHQDKQLKSEAKQCDTLDGVKIRTFYENIISSEKEESKDQDYRKERPLKQRHGVKKFHKTWEETISKVEYDESRSKRSRQDISSCTVNVAKIKTENGCDVIEQSNSSNVDGAAHSVQTGCGELVSRLGLRLLKHAQEGDTENVKTCLLQGISVDYHDQFGWSALMCASVGGYPDTVQYLLEQKADVFKREKSGMTAQDLARQKGHNHIVQLLEQSLSSSCVVSVSSTSSLFEEQKQDACKTFFCSVCKQEFVDTNEKQHKTSTVHLFNMKLKPKSNNYLIPESNVGYRMLLKGGWDAEKGLGPDGGGNKFPVKTILKRDRKGLGLVQKVSAKVTHFNPHDKNAVSSSKPKCERKTSMRTLSKRAMRLKEKRDRNWEIQLRRYMNSD